MEVITLCVPKIYKKSRREIVEEYIRKNILGKENPAVIVASPDPNRGRDKVFQILTLNNIKKPLQWDDGRIYRHPIEEGREKVMLEYFSKFSCVFICK